MSGQCCTTGPSSNGKGLGQIGRLTARETGDESACDQKTLTLPWSQYPLEVRVDGKLPRMSRDQALSLFWRVVVGDVNRELEKWRADGWEPVSVIGPETVRYRILKKRVIDIDRADVMLALFSLGLVAVLEIIGGWAWHWETWWRFTHVELTLRRRPIHPIGIEVCASD